MVADYLMSRMLVLIRLAEFRRHKETTNKVHIIGFLSQWKLYLDQLPAGPDGGKAFRGIPLDPTTLEKVRGTIGVMLSANDPTHRSSDVRGATWPVVRSYACNKGRLETCNPAARWRGGSRRVMTRGVIQYL